MKSKLIFEDAYYDGQSYIYFFSREINALFRQDVKTNTAEFLLTIEEYKNDAERLYGTVVCACDKLYFCPSSADDILIYDIKSNSYSLIPIEKRNDYKGDDAKFFSMSVSGNHLYIFPAHYPAIIQLDMKTNSVHYLTSWLKDIESDLGDGKDYFRQSVCNIDGSMIVPFCYKDSVLILDTKDERITIKDIKTGRTDHHGFAGICRDGDTCWMVSLTGDMVYAWNYYTDQIDEYQLQNRNKEGSYAFVGCYYWRGNIFIRPAKRNDFYIINVEDKTINSYSADTYDVDVNAYSEISSTVLAIVEIEEDYLLMCTRNGICYKLYKQGNDWEFAEMEFDNEEAIKKWMTISNYKTGNKILKEKEGFWRLDTYLQTIIEQ